MRARSIKRKARHLVWVGLLLLGCRAEAPPFRCSSDNACGLAGRCEPDGFCSLVDDSCPSGRRYDDSAATASRTCVPSQDAGLSADARPNPADADAPLLDTGIDGGVILTDTGRPDDAGVDGGLTRQFDGGEDGGVAPVCAVTANAVPRSDRCVNTVCGRAQSCCTGFWSQECVNLAETLCTRSCTNGIMSGGQSGLAVAYLEGTTTKRVTTLASADWEDNFTVNDMAAGDYDGDGDSDLVVVTSFETPTSTQANVRILRNEGLVQDQPNFFYLTDFPADSEFVGLSRVAWGDPDGDHDLDIAVNRGTAMVWARNENGVFPNITLLIDGAVNAFTWGYFSENGQTELVVGLDGQNANLFAYDHDAQALVQVDSWVGPPNIRYLQTCHMSASSARAGVAFATSTSVGVLFNSGQRLLSQPLWTPVSTPEIIALACVDLDGGGTAEIVTVHRANRPDDPATVRVYSTGNGALEWMTSLPFEGRDVALGDVNGDGRLDIVVGGHQTGVSPDPILFLLQEAGGPLSFTSVVAPSLLIDTEVFTTELIYLEPSVP